MCDLNLCIRCSIFLFCNWDCFKRALVDVSSLSYTFSFMSCTALENVAFLLEQYYANTVH